MKKLTTLGFAALALSACGYPGKSLNGFEKQADLAWVYGVFERNYAPAEWKQKQFSVSLSQAKQECESGAESITDGGEFIAHLNRCVNRFRDAHTRMIAGGMTLPEFAKVAYLGFRTETVRIDLANPEKKDEKEKTEPKPPLVVVAFRVKELLPTTEADEFPIKVGDFVVEVNGEPVEAYASRELVPYSNLGNDESSLAVVGELFPVRSSHSNQLPKEDNLRLKVVRGSSSFDLSLPWTVKDLLTFENEQRQAAEARKKVEDEKKKTETPARVFSWEGDELVTSFWEMFNKFRTSPGQRVNLLLESSFRIHKFDPTLRFLETLTGEEKKEERLPVEIALPTPSLKIENASFPARVFLLEDGSRIGYVRVASFGLGDEDVKNFASLHETFSKMKVKSVIYDLLNNGGGSLVHGLRMANLLTTKDLKYPSLQLALNDNWLNGFHGDSLYRVGGGGSDARRTQAKRVYEWLQADVRSGLRISRPISATELDPFVLTDSKADCARSGKCLSEEVKRVLLINEMCASMCDIFASTFRDNQLGPIVGSQTMGAGGNVVMHGAAPITKVILMQTESLVVDSQGEYLENQGVKPTDPIDTLMDASRKYSATYQKALELAK